MNKIEEQHIKHINQFLIEHYHLYYIDVRTELVDHIASEIEERINNGNAYDAAFIAVFAQWDKSLKLSKFYFKGVPLFLAKEWAKERWIRFGKNVVQGLLAVVVFVLMERILSVRFDESDWFVILFGFSGIGLIAVLYLHNIKVLQEVTTQTARGTFLRLEQIRSFSFIFSVSFVIIPQMVRGFGYSWNIDWYLELYVFLFTMIVVDKISWYREYRQERLLQFKWDKIK